MMAPLTVAECKSWLFKLGIKHGVAPKLISERLLSNEDKEDMLKGLISFETLDCHVKFWKEYGMANYAHSTVKQYERFSAYIKLG